MITMSHHFDYIRKQIAANDNTLAEARRRQDLALKSASSFAGVLRTYKSGSLAHLTVNDPVQDADCGLVLNRQVFLRLGPDGDDVGPSDLLEDFRAFLGPKVRMQYPSAHLRITKRAVKIFFSCALPSGEDPTVDIVVGLTRRDGAGLWIPNTQQDRWDPSHPERHTELFSLPSESVAAVRRRAVRLAKEWNNSFLRPRALQLQR